MTPIRVSAYQKLFDTYFSRSFTMSAAEFSFKAVHVLALALANSVDQFRVCHFLDFRGAQILGLDLAAFGRVSRAVFRVADRAFVEIYVLRAFLRCGRSAIE